MQVPFIDFRVLKSNLAKKWFCLGSKRLKPQMRMSSTPNSFSIMQYLFLKILYTKIIAKYFNCYIKNS